MTEQPDVRGRRLSAREVERLDPYQFMAVLGKNVIHPGGRRSTDELLQWADLRPELNVLDVGAGVGTTALEMARRFDCRVTAVDIDPQMLARARANVDAAGLGDRVTVGHADMQALEFADDSFDRVVIEAVTMFVDRHRAAKEVVRVCIPGGRVLDHEFIYVEPPTPDVRRIFEGEMCPGISFSTSDDWLELYRRAGLTDLQATTGPFVMMTPAGMWRDEGPGNLLRMMIRMTTRLAHLRKMSWMMPRILRVRSSLGYVVLVGTKPSPTS
ncbi:MAG: class I SAM-dependent methyltransferase [Actinomycetota bacterium]